MFDTVYKYSNLTPLNLFAVKPCLLSGEYNGLSWSASFRWWWPDRSFGNYRASD